MTFAESALLNKYNLNEEALNEIELRVSSMSEDELIERKEYLEAAIVELEETKNTTQNPSVLKEVTNLFELYSTEDIYIAFFLAIAAASVSELVDLGGNTSTPGDSNPPVITILGDNPAIVELGESYTDAGATASDDSGSATLVTSGTVDTNTVGSYHPYLYSYRCLW